MTKILSKTKKYRLSYELEHIIDKRGDAHKTEETIFQQWFKNIQRTSII